MTFPIWLPRRLMTLQDGCQWRQWWCQVMQTKTCGIATVSYVALYLCTARCTWALSRRVLSEDAHSWQWETLKWENRMLGPRHRFSSLVSSFFQLYADTTVKLSARRCLYDVQCNETNWSGPDHHFMYWLWNIRQIYLHWFKIQSGLTNNNSLVAGMVEVYRCSMINYTLLLYLRNLTLNSQWIICTSHNVRRTCICGYDVCAAVEHNEIILRIT